jgi:acyl-CoA synthetase (AMP-forming)/AMP-acid ligase II
MMKEDEGVYIPDEEPKTNFVEVLKDRNKWRGGKTAYEYYGKRVCYEELWARVDTASRALSQLGVVKDDIILCLAPNIPEEEEIWFGATQIGAIVDYIDSRPDSQDPVANSRKLLELIEFEQPKHIVAIDKCYPAMLQPIENELKELGINNLVLLSLSDSMDDNERIEYAKDVINYERLRSNERPIFDDVSQSLLFSVLSKVEKIDLDETQVVTSLAKNSPLNICWFSELAEECENSSFEVINDPDLVNYIGHTSEASGARPKPIPLTNRNAISSIIQGEMAGFGPQEGRTSLHLLPGFDPFGRYTNGIQTYYNKGISIHVPEFLISEFGYLLLKYRPSSIMTPPAFVTGLVESKYLDQENLDYLDKVMVEGDGIRPQDEDRINLWLLNHNSHAVIKTTRMSQ